MKWIEKLFTEGRARWLFEINRFTLGFFEKKPLAYDPVLGPLLIRYRIIFTGSWGLYVHKLLRSDNDRALHDHPWSFFTFLLGPYVEYTPEGRFERRAFTLHYRPAYWLHRLELDKITWTIILQVGQRRRWGFVENGEWIPWDVYVADREKARGPSRMTSRTTLQRLTQPWMCKEPSRV